MLDLLKTKIGNYSKTIKFPPEKSPLPENYRGLPILNSKKCDTGCNECIKSCPVEAITLNNLTLDLGRCVFCGECENVCPENAISFSTDYRISNGKRGGLVVSEDEYIQATQLGGELKKLLGRSLNLRQVSAGGCGGCEAELSAVNNVVFDLSRFGINFVASPRHADGLIITGTITANMKLAVKEAMDAVAKPSIVIAVGSCAISGGIFASSDNSDLANRGISESLPVDLYIPGCPPHPLTILDGLLRLLGRIKEDDFSPIIEGC